MGEKERKPFQLTFNGLLKVDFQGSRVTSDGGLILVRELDERLGLGELIDQHLADSRHGLNTQLPLSDLLRQSVYSRLAGYEDVNDAERVSADPTFRLIGSQKIWERGAAGELFPRVGFIVTNMILPSRSLVRFYNKRGTAERWIKEGKQATSWTRLSCHRFRANEVRLQLSVVAYNLGNLWRRLGLFADATTAQVGPTRILLNGIEATPIGATAVTNVASTRLGTKLATGLYQHQCLFGLNCRLPRARPS